MARFRGGAFRAGRRFDLVRTRANGRPAFGAYARAPDGVRHETGLFVIAIAGDRVGAMTRFETGVLPWFDRSAHEGSAALRGRVVVTLTSQDVPYLSTHCPWRAPHGDLANGTVTVPPAESPSQ